MYIDTQTLNTERQIYRQTTDRHTQTHIETDTVIYKQTYREIDTETETYKETDHGSKFRPQC